MKKWIMMMTAVAMLAGYGSTALAEEVIAKGKTVKFDYTLTVEGKVMDTSDGREPLQYVHGDSMIIPGLESQLEGLKVGDERTVKVAPEDGYGPLNVEAVQEVPKEVFGDTSELIEGQQVGFQDENGQVMPATVLEISDTTIKMDFNHPLAGKTLTFQVKIVSVE